MFDRVVHIIFMDTPYHGFDVKALALISRGSIAAQFPLWFLVLNELNTEFGEVAEKIWFTSFFASHGETLPQETVEEREMIEQRNAQGKL